ncbi:MAG: hypothetical protein K2P44_13965 [Lachnospiraceae bacterium]|nr:hypothetical protein [Lachnospiraceae bacterium]
MDYYSAFPYYMGYQGFGQWAQPGVVPEDRILEDLEYLQQMYPTYARKYQGVISSVVDKMDYDGSFIYDQYPDKLTIQRMVTSVMAVIKTNEQNAKEGSAVSMNTAMPVNGIMSMNPPSGMPENGMPMMPETDVMGSNVTDKTLTENAPWSEKEPWIRELVTVLMYYEILTRRRKKNRQWFNGTAGNGFYQI